jgi:hypothetical protein
MNMIFNVGNFVLNWNPVLFVIETKRTKKF